MSTQFKEKVLWTILNKHIEERKAQASKITSLDLELIYQAMESYKRLAIIKRGADPVDGSDTHIDLAESIIGEVIEHPYAKKYSFLINPNDEPGTTQNSGSNKKQAAATKGTKGTDTTDQSTATSDLQPVSTQ